MKFKLSQIQGVIPKQQNHCCDLTKPCDCYAGGFNEFTEQMELVQLEIDVEELTGIIQTGKLCLASSENIAKAIAQAIPTLIRKAQTKLFLYKVPFQENYYLRELDSELKDPIEVKNQAGAWRIKSEHPIETIVSHKCMEALTNDHQ